VRPRRDPCEPPEGIRLKHVAFVAPFFLDATLRFVDAVADVPGVRLGLVSQDPLEKLPPRLRSKLSAHHRIQDALDPQGIADGVRGVAAAMGGVERVLGTLEQLQVPLGEVREALRLPGMRAEAARNFRDKARMKDVLRAAGLPVAQHALCETEGEAHRFAAAVGYPLVAKPPEGAGAKATFRVDSHAQLEEALRFASPAAGRPLLLEEFVTGDEHSFDAVVIGGRPVWHSVSHYLPSPLDVLRNPWIQWCVVRPREVSHPRYDDVRRVAFAALSALGLETGVAHLEWFRRRDGSLAIGEVGARPPGAQFCSLISWQLDLDFYAAWARLAVYDEFDAVEPRFAAGAAYLRGQGSGVVTAIRGLDVAQKEMGDLVVEARLPKAGQGPSGGYEGEGYVILRHERTEVVEQALKRLVSIVRVELSEPS
jgi:hypothetical protein